MQSYNEARHYLTNVLPWPEAGSPPFINVHASIELDDKRKAYPGRGTRDVREAVNYVEYSLKRPGSDIYACQSAQSQGEEQTGKNNYKYFRAIRASSNATYLRSLFLDIDVKEGKGYATITEAVGALISFCSETGMPAPSMLVHSGGGVHVYWSFDRNVTPYEWRPLAFALAEATKKHGLKCDTQCTIDDARLLRVPDTLNYKTTPPRPVSILGGIRDVPTYTYEKLDKVLTPYKQVGGPVWSLPPRPPLMRGENDVLSAGVEGSYEPLDFRSLVHACPWVMEAVTTGGKEFDNPQWNLATFLASFTEQEANAAHIMARGHKDYDYDGTQELYERKVRERTSKSLGWPSCATISGSGAKACQGCPNRALGKGPGHFARRVNAPATVVPANSVGGDTVSLLTGAGGQQTNSTGPAGAVYNSWDLPSGYIRNQHGVVCIIATQEDGTVVETPLVEFPMYEPRYHVGGSMLYFETSISNKPRLMQVPAALISREMDLAEHLFGESFVFQKDQVKALQRFMVSWIQKLQHSKQAVILNEAFGWTHEGNQMKGFAYNERLYTPHGEENVPRIDPVTSAQYSVQGDLNVWTTCAKLITDQNRPDIEVIVATAFAAPIIKFTSHDGVVGCAWSESGTGKTSALKVATAVWGHAKASMNTRADTIKSTKHKMGAVRNLPIFWDEIKGEDDMRNFAKLLFDISSGKDQSRLNSAVKQVHAGSWETILFTCTNDPLSDYAAEHGKDAGSYRLVEYRVVAPPVKPNKEDQGPFTRQMGKLHHNYGMAGDVYAKFLGENFPAIEIAVGNEYDRLTVEHEAEMPERFWVAFIASVLVGARYANQLGLTEFHVEDMEKFLVGVFNQSRKRLKESDSNMSDAVNISQIMNDFIQSQSQRHMLITDRIPSGRGKPVASKIMNKNTSLINGVHVRVGLEDKRLLISSTAMSEYCKRTKKSRPAIQEALEKLGALRHLQGAFITSGCSSEFPSGKAYLWDIDLALFSELDFVD